jgi:hypothetical protein
MVDTSESATQNFWQAVQHLAGVNLLDVAGWIGPGLAAVWVWDSWFFRGSLPHEPPIRWFGHVGRTWGLSAGWATATDQWLHAHPQLFPILLVAALLSAGSAVRYPGARLNLTWLALAAALSTRSFFLTFGLFLAISLVLCLAASARDASTREADLRLSLLQWARGPGTAVFGVILAPLILLLVAVEQYRLEEAPPAYGIELGIDADKLPNEPLSDMPGKVALHFLATAILVAADRRDRRGALFSLSRRWPTGSALRPSLVPPRRSQPPTSNHMHTDDDAAA